MSSKKGNSAHLSSKQKQKKAWHDPVVTRVKLNPEQAVLACCSTGGKNVNAAGSMCSPACGGPSISASNT